MNTLRTILLMRLEPLRRHLAVWRAAVETDRLRRRR